jgi:hypothetical protein
MNSCEIVESGHGDNKRYQARLGGVPLGRWRRSKIDACRDIVRDRGPRAHVIDRTGSGPRADWALFDTLI